MKVCMFGIDLRLFGLIFVITLGYNFNSYCHAATIYSVRNIWETAAGGVSDVLEDFNEINIDMELPIDMSSFSLSTTGRTRARSIIDSDPYISPTDGKTNDYLVNDTTYFLATTTRENYTDESVVITFDNPVISWGVDLNPHSGDLSDGVIFATNSGESGTFYLPSTDSTEFRGFVAETQFTSVTFTFNPNSVGAFAEAGWDNLAAHYSNYDSGIDEIIGTWSNGIWHWDAATSSQTQMTPYVTNGDIAAGDFNGDGKADVASIWTDGLWYQDGNTLSWTKIDDLPPYSVTFGDVNGN